MTDGTILEERETAGYLHTLSLRLTDAEYRRLRRFVTVQEDRLGHRLTHQTVLKTALREFLDRG